MTRHAVTLLVILGVASAQNNSSPAGTWMSDMKGFDVDNYYLLQIGVDGEKLTGRLGPTSFEGTFRNGRIDAAWTPDRTTFHFTGTVTGDRITGKIEVVGGAASFTWEATRQAARTAKASPQTHTFEPTEFHHFFSDAIPPVLHINPGDTVKTWSVDAGGTDPKGIRRTQGGNPLTGPFYIEGALPGDTLVVHFTRIRLNRDTAISGALIDSRTLNTAYVQQRKPVEGYDSDWKLDRAGGFASLANPTEKLKDYKIPLAPMLGCVGVAPATHEQYRSGNLGDYGGNMDYNRLREGVTVYLPVFAPGALLFVGDGHAAQGAGELTGNALETSMDIEFNVELLTGVLAPLLPRMEDDEYLMASGIAGGIDDAFRQATTNLTRWLERRYGLNAAEVSSVLNTSMVYDVAEAVDPQVHVVAKAPKSALAALKRVN